jgi:hypothetical protein
MGKNARIFSAEARSSITSSSISNVVITVNVIDQSGGCAARIVWSTRAIVSRGDSYDNALAKSVIGLFKTKGI